MANACNHELRAGLRFADDSLDTISQVHNVEIDEQTNTAAGQFQIREYLSDVDTS